MTVRRRSGNAVAVGLLVAASMLNLAPACEPSLRDCDHNGYSKAILKPTLSGDSDIRRISIRWTTYGVEPSCVGDSATNLTVNSSGTYNYCRAIQGFPVYSDVVSNSCNYTNYYNYPGSVATDAFGKWDWHIFGSSDGRTSMHAIVTGTDTGNAYIDCNFYAISGGNAYNGHSETCEGGNT